MGANRSRTATLGRRVLVPVANPASIRPLLELAAELVDPDGEIVPLTVLAGDADAGAIADAWQGMAAAEALATRLEVRARGQVALNPHLGDAVLEAVQADDTSLVLMGWRGASSTNDVFGRLIDHVLGRSSVPLAVVRLGALPAQRILLPISGDHLLPGGSGGLELAVALATRLRSATSRPATILRTGARQAPLPEVVTSLGDRVHHDRRRTHQAVASFAGPTDLIVAPVAPTVSGLRAATTHLAWAAPDATLLVAIDVGPITDRSFADAVADAGRRAPSRSTATEQRVHAIVVTVRLPEHVTVPAEVVDRLLTAVGPTEHLMGWWPVEDPRLHVRVTVHVQAPDTNRAIGRTVACLHDAPELAGAEISYDLEHEPSRPRRVPGLVVDTDHLGVHSDEVESLGRRTREGGEA
ncbi:MAG: universal stress protein [Nitriliruptoraceae bacterium]